MAVRTLLYFTKEGTRPKVKSVSFLDHVKSYGSPAGTCCVKKNSGDRSEDELTFHLKSKINVLMTLNIDALILNAR